MSADTQGRDEPPGIGPRAALPHDKAESGYILIAVIFMVALVVLSLAVAAPKIAAAIQRDRELELVHRGLEYKHAIRLYYKKFGAYPTSIDQLESANNMRFLRKRYTDPLTGKDDWKLIHMGEAHVRPLGFFGQAMGVGTPIAGASNIGSPIGGGGGTAGITNSPFGATGASSGSSSMLNGSASTGASGAAGGAGIYAPSTDTGSDSSTGGSGSSASTSTSSSSSTTGSTASSTTLGGGPIVGIMPPQTKATILTYKLKTHYNEWEFVYDPVEEATASGSIVGGSGATPVGVNGNGSPGTGTGTGTANPFGTAPSTGNTGNTNSPGQSTPAPQ